MAKPRLLFIILVALTSGCVTATDVPTTVDESSSAMEVALMQVRQTVSPAAKRFGETKLAPIVLKILRRYLSGDNAQRLPWEMTHGWNSSTYLGVVRGEGGYGSAIMNLPLDPEFGRLQAMITALQPAIAANSRAGHANPQLEQANAARAQLVARVRVAFQDWLQQNFMSLRAKGTVQEIMANTPDEKA